MNCPIKIADIKRSIHIYGPDIVEMKGESTRKKPPKIEEIEYIPLPPEILEYHEDTMVSVDYVFIRGLTHLHSTSRGDNYRTTKCIKGKRVNMTYIVLT